MNRRRWWPAGGGRCGPLVAFQEREEDKVRTRVGVAGVVTLILPFLAALLVVVTMLRLLALIPDQVEALASRESNEYRPDSRLMTAKSVAEAEASLGAAVWVPVYFPDYLAWPPSTITIQRYPDRSVTLVFRYPDQREAVVVRQILRTDVDRDSLVFDPSAVVKRSRIDIGGGEGILIEGLDGEGYAQNILSWTQGDRFIMMAGQLPTSELLRMGRSLRDVSH